MQKIFLSLFLIAIIYAQPSSIDLKTVYSYTFTTLKYFNVYFPAGYDSTTERYPVVYLFRGHEREWANDGEDASRRGNIKTVADSLIAKGAMGKVILVMPGFSAPPTANDYLYFFSELVPHVDKTFRTYKSRWMRGIDGFSLGGLTTLTMMSTRPEYFSSIGSYDGTFSMFDKSLLNSASPKLLSEMKRLKILFHSSSPSGPSNYNNNVEILNLLQQKGITNTFSELILTPNAMHNWYFADLHMALTFPYHYQKFFTSPNNIPLTIYAPNGNNKLSSSFQISWNKINVTDSVSTFIFVSDDDGKNWKFLSQKLKNDTTLEFQSNNYPDGALYRFRAITLGDTISGIFITPRVTIDNPDKNGSPYVFLLNPISGELSGTTSVQWEAGDPENDALTLSLFISYDDKKSWKLVANNLQNGGSYQFNTTTFPNSSNIFLRLTVSDGNSVSSSISEIPLAIKNPRVQYPVSTLNHIFGNSTASITLTRNNSQPATTDTYQIYFENNSGGKSYSVKNTTKNVVLLSGITWSNQFTEGPSFDGFHLLINDETAIQINTDSLRWKNNSTTLEGNISLMNIVMPDTTLIAKPFPYDYEIRISANPIDTSMEFYDVPPSITNFTIWNTTLNKKTPFLFIDFNGDGSISEFDELYIFENSDLAKSVLSWHIFFSGVTGSQPPFAGDTYRIVTKKPLANDVYEFTSYLLVVENNFTSPNQFEVWQNYPNPFNPETVIQYQIPNDDFVTVKIYDVLGREVASLVDKFHKAGNHFIHLNSVNYSLASGVYLYRISTKKFSSVKKMILLR